MKKFFVSFGVAIALMFGGALAAAPAAHAYPPDYYKVNCYWDTITWYTWKDYNWWQEFWEFKKDGYVVKYIAFYRC